MQIGLEMLRADVMPSAHDAALEKGERGFDGVGVNVPVHIAALAVNDGLVILDSGLPHGDSVGIEIVSEHHFHIFADVLADVLGERARLRILGVKETESAIALADADHYFLVVHAGADALSAIHSADIGSVHFNFAVEHWFVGQRHRMADTMAEVPSCFVTADPKSALNLAGGHALPCFTEQERCGEPFHEWQVRIIEHGSGCNRKLIVAIFAVEELFFGFQFDYIPMTAQAARAFGEAQARQEFAALGIGRKHGVDIN